MSRSPWDSISRSSQRALLHNLGSSRTVFDPAPAARGVFLGIILSCPDTKDKFPDHGSTGQRLSPLYKLQIYVGSFGSGSAAKATAIWKVFSYVIRVIYPSFLPPYSVPSYSGWLFQSLQLQDVQTLPTESIPNLLPGISLEVGWFSKAISHLASLTSFPFMVSLPVPFNSSTFFV